MSDSSTQVVHTVTTSPIAELARQLTRISIRRPIIRLANPQQNLPLANTQTGNLFRDRFTTDLFWYLPTFELAADPDPAFHFMAKQEGVDASGNSFNRASLALSIRKSVPSDVQLAQSQNSGST